jgi:glycosyltransferase involved in cell wall biosynthesis
MLTKSPISQINSGKRIPYAFKQVTLKFSKEVSGLISVIVPIYNTKEIYLREALDSIIAQTFENWEAILVNDGSTDKTVEKVCTEYVEKDSRFKYICKNNEGTLLARKAGLENARGEFIANLDNDDVYEPQFMEKMLSKIKESDYDFVWCNCKRSTQLQILNAEFSQNKLENCLKHKDFGGPTWNKLIKRCLYAKILFPQIHIIGCEDYIQLLQIIYQSERAGYVPDILYLYRVHISASNSNGAALRRHYASTSSGAVAIYLVMEQLFNASEAEKHPTFINLFPFYFLLNKKEVEYYEIKYIDNFIPAFLNGVKKSRDIIFLKKMLSILACKDFSFPFKFCFEIKNRYRKYKLGL